MNPGLTSHRCHDSGAIIRRWRAVARAARLRLHTLHVTQGGFPVLFLETQHQSKAGLYLSTGVHGDEPAPVTALLEWAEANLPLLRQESFVLVPLFNPDGLRANTRNDEHGRDLNREFHDTQHPHFTEWHRVMAGRKFRLGVMFHEDYDAQGIYAYELSGRSGLTTGPLLQAASDWMPRDTRRSIDGFPAKAGVIKRSRIPKGLTGLPEALVVFRQYAQATFTIETPSEFSFTDRVAAHRAVLDELTKGS
jgi:protein MpaA